MLSEFPVRAQQWRDFATAHSCGLRRNASKALADHVALCHSAFVRVATGEKIDLYAQLRLCHSAFVRVATRRFLRYGTAAVALPQRIRAGCDCGKAMQRTANLLREGR